MSDPENGPPADRPPRGVPIYAVEGLVLAAAAAAWLTVPFVTGLGILGSNLLVPPVIAGAVASAVACSVLADNRAPLGAFASLCLTCTVAHAYLLFEAAATPACARYYLGASVLGPPAAAVSLAFLAMHSLLALAAIHDRLWAQTLWIEGSFIVVHLLLGVLATIHSSAAPDLAGCALLFAAVIGLGVLTALRCYFPREGYLRLGAGIAAVLAVLLGWGVALGLRFGGWPYCVLSLLLSALLAMRFADEWLAERPAPASSARPSAPPLPPPSAVQPGAQPWPRQQAFAAPSMRPRVLFAAPTVQPPSPSAEALLFAGHARAARQQAKKVI